MTALTPVLPKLELLMPRLASTHDGEVVAAVRAIDRALHSAGLDWHDVVAELSLAKPQVTSHIRSPRPLTWRGVADWCARHGDGSRTSAS